MPYPDKTPQPEVRLTMILLLGLVLFCFIVPAAIGLAIRLVL